MSAVSYSIQMIRYIIGPCPLPLPLADDDDEGAKGGRRTWEVGVPERWL